MPFLRPDSDGTSYQCRAPAGDRCERCGRSWCADHEAHERLCGRCHTEYLHRHGAARGRARAPIVPLPAAFTSLAAGFVAAKLWLRAGGRPSPADFVFMWIPLAVLVVLTYVLLAGLLEDARAARRCERFIVERTRRRRPTNQ